jgi:hypothetical protein
LLKELSGNELAKSRKTTGTLSPLYTPASLPGGALQVNFSPGLMAENHIDLASTLLLFELLLPSRLIHLLYFQPDRDNRTQKCIHNMRLHSCHGHVAAFGLLNPDVECLE